MPALIALLSVLALHVGTHALAAPPNPTNHAPGGQLLRFRLPFETASLDWNLGDIPIPVIQNTQRGLYRVDAEGKVIKDLVESSQTSAEGKVWQFKVKDGIFWSDGMPVTADHCVASLKRLLDPQLASSYAYFLFDVEGASANPSGSDPKIRVINSTTFEIRLTRAVPYLPALLTHWTTYPIRPDLIARYRDHFTNPEHMAYTGPFKITEVRPQIRIVMERNTKAETPAKLFRLEGWILADDNTSLNLYEGSHLEFITDPGIGASKHKDLQWKPSPITYFVGIGAKHPLTSSRAGVLALTAALDRTQIPKALGAPHRPALGFVPPEIWSILGSIPSDATLDTIPLSGSKALAKNLLKDAGWASGAKVPPITLRYFNRPQMRELAEWLQEQWRKNLGIPVELESADTKSYWSQLETKPANLFLNSKGTSYPDPDVFFRLFLSSSMQNYGRWADTEYDTWVAQASSHQDPAARRDLYVKASRKLLVEKPALIPLYFRATGYLFKPFVKDVVINPLTSVDFEKAYTETKAP